MIKSSGFLLMVALVCIENSAVVNCMENTIPDDGFDHKKEQLWQQDLGDTFKIDASTEGLQKVHLKCGADSMQVFLETDVDFTGVMYTKGSFYKQTEPCFRKPENGKSARSLTMKFSLDQCHTIQNGEVFTNVVVVQHDPDLVTPGDAAFSLECDFRQPRNLTVAADMQTRDREASGSRITLISPDPSASAELEPAKHDTVFSESHSVTFKPLAPHNKKRQQVKGTVEALPHGEHLDARDEL